MLINLKFKVIFSLIFIEHAQISYFTWDLCTLLSIIPCFICTSNAMTWVLDAINVISWVLSVKNVMSWVLSVINVISFLFSVTTVMNLVLWLCSVDKELINSQGKSSLHGRCLRIPGTSLPQHVNELCNLVWFFAPRA